MTVRMAKHATVPAQRHPEGGCGQRRMDPKRRRHTTEFQSELRVRSRAGGLFVDKIADVAYVTKEKTQSSTPRRSIRPSRQRSGRTPSPYDLHQPVSPHRERRSGLEIFPCAPRRPQGRLISPNGTESRLFKRHQRHRHKCKVSGQRGRHGLRLDLSDKRLLGRTEDRFLDAQAYRCSGKEHGHAPPIRHSLPYGQDGTPEGRGR